MSVIYKADAETFQLNSIAKGHDNISGLRNIEIVEVNGNRLSPVRDLGTYEGGQRVVNGRGIFKETGFPSQPLETGALSNAMRWWIQTELLGGAISGPVTFKARKYSVPMLDTDTALHFIANATLTLVPNRATQRYVDGIQDFSYDLTRLVIIEEDQMYGSIYVEGGAVAQSSIGTTPVLLTAFDTNGNSNGITPDHTDDDLTALVAGEYKPEIVLNFTGTASAVWDFHLYKNGADTGIQGTIATNATPDPETICFGPGRTVTVAANDVFTVYVNTDDGGSGDAITVVDGAFSLESVSLSS